MVSANSEQINITLVQVDVEDDRVQGLDALLHQFQLGFAQFLTNEMRYAVLANDNGDACLLYTSPSPRDS